MFMKRTESIPYDVIQTQFNLRLQDNYHGVDVVVIHADELHLFRLDTILNPDDRRHAKELKVREHRSLDSHPRIEEFYTLLHQMDQLLKEMTQ